MRFIEGNCPKCQGVLHIPEDRDKVICMYCGEEILVSDVTGTEVTAEEHVEIPADYEKFLYTGMSELPKLLCDIIDPLKNFNKNKYEDAFREIYNLNQDTFVAIENAYCYAQDKADVIKSLAVNFVNVASNEIDCISKKGAKDQKLMDFNLCLAVYVIPTILEFKGTSSEILADKILEEWKNKFPKTNVGKSTFENIKGGFRKKLCYITTAVCETLGKGDDCYELTLLRNYRDCYLMEQPDGEEIISEYYDIAPTIVKRINKLPNSDKIYKKVWNTYLHPCIQLIEDDKNLECKDVYYKMVRDLQREYCH